MEPDGTAFESSERSVWKNFGDVIVEPSATFRDVAARPRWLVPLIVITIATLVVSYFLMPLYAEMQQLGLARGDMPPEQREEALAQMERFKWVGLLIAPIAYVVITALSALLFWGWGAISGAKNAVYKVAFTALVYAGFIGLLQSILQAVVVAIKGAEQVAREGGPPLFGLSLFIERGDMPRLLWGQIANINFFSIWYAVLVAIAAIHALKSSRGSAYALAVVFFILWGFATAFQGAPQG